MFSANVQQCALQKTQVDTERGSGDPYTSNCWANDRARWRNTDQSESSSNCVPELHEYDWSRNIAIRMSSNLLLQSLDHQSPQQERNNLSSLTMMLVSLSFILVCFEISLYTCTTHFPFTIQIATVPHMIKQKLSVS